MKKKRIAYILADVSTGGVAKVVENITNNIDSEKYEQYIISLTNKKNQYNLKGNLIYLTGIGKNIFTKGLNFLYRYYLLKKYLKKYKFDVLIGFGAAANILMLLLPKTSYKIITEHNVKSIENTISFSLLESVVNKFYNYAISIFYNNANTIVPVSKVMGNDLVNNFGIKENKIHVIYNGVDIDEINRLSQRTLSKNEVTLFSGKTIICVGAVSIQKGQWHLIRIIPILRQMIPDIKLIILGDGAYREQLEKLCIDLSVEDCVFFLGRVKNPYKYMKMADVFALSSLYEGFPNVIVEALSLGIPVVSVDCPSGPKEMLSPNENINSSVTCCTLGQYGILTPPFPIEENVNCDNELSYEEKELMQGIICMLRDSETNKHYRKMSLLRSNDFAVSKMVDEYNNIIETGVNMNG